MDKVTSLISWTSKEDIGSNPVPASENMEDNVQPEPEQGDHQPTEGDDVGVDPEPGYRRHRHRPQVERQMVQGNVVCSVVQDGARLSWLENVIWQVNRSPSVLIPLSELGARYT